MNRKWLEGIVQKISQGKLNYKVSYLLNYIKTTTLRQNKLRLRNKWLIRRKNVNPLKPLGVVCGDGLLYG